MIFEYLFMMKKRDRHTAIKAAILTNEITSQEQLLNILINKGFDITQATLSRDTKELKIVKMPSASGNYAYQFSDAFVNIGEDTAPLSNYGFVSIEFSGQLAVIKTRPGYAMAIAGEIDNKATQTILGTVAGDDTILLIPREGIGREEVISSLARFIPNI